MPDQKSNAIAVTEATEITPMGMIQKAFETAIASGQGLEVVDRILAEQRAMLARQDEIAFNAALRRVQDRLQAVEKKGWNPQTKSWYAEAQDVDDAIDDLLKQERMTLTFEPRQSANPQEILIVGVLSLDGTAYRREYVLPMPTDGAGPKGGGVMSRTHATGSAMSYGMRYLKISIFNLKLSKRKGMPDDDGNRAGGVQQRGQLPERDQIVHLDNIKNAGDMAELQRLYNLALEAADKIGDTASTRQFVDAKNIRVAQLRKEGRA